jgi:hypothetical protein
VVHDIAFACRLVELSQGRFEGGMTPLTPLPGTEFRNDAASWGIAMLDPDFATGQLINGCFHETRTLSSVQIQGLCRRFNDELDAYSLDFASRFPPRRIKEEVVLSAERDTKTWLVRRLLDIPHFRRTEVLRHRDGHRFLFEAQLEAYSVCVPIRVLLSLDIEEEHGLYTINPESAFSFDLTPREFMFYRFFAGKLSFEDIAERLSIMLNEPADALLKECLQVYRKCEDRLTALVVV